MTDKHPDAGVRAAIEVVEEWQRQHERHADNISISHAKHAVQAQAEVLSRLSVQLQNLPAQPDTSALVEALEPFAAEADRIDPDGPDPTVNDGCEIWQVGSTQMRRSKITYGNLRKARAVLQSKQKAEA